MFFDQSLETRQDDWTHETCAQPCWSSHCVDHDADAVTATQGCMGSIDETLHGAGFATKVLSVLAGTVLATGGLRGRSGSGQGPDFAGDRADDSGSTRLLPPAAPVAGLLPPARPETPQGNYRVEIPAADCYPGPDGPWIGAGELGDAVHTLAALHSASPDRPYAGKINVLSDDVASAARTVDLFHRAFPESTTIVHTPPRPLADADTATFERTVKSNGADRPPLGHPFDATRMVAERHAADPLTSARLRERLLTLTTASGRAEVRSYLTDVSGFLLDPDAPKAIVALRSSADAYGAFRDSTAESTRQLTEILQGRGYTVVAIGAPPAGAELPDGVVDLTGHWRRISDLPSQAFAFRELASNSTAAAIGVMSGLLDLVHLGSGMPVVQFGPAFRMGMWEQAFGPDRVKVLDAPSYDATSTEVSKRRFDTETEDRLLRALDAIAPACGSGAAKP